MTTPPASVWYQDADGCWRIAGLDCDVWMSPRPPYCDRGRWLAHVELRPDGDWRRLSLDSSDGFPRYYFDLDRAKLEIEAWLRVRNQWIPPLPDHDTHFFEYERNAIRLPIGPAPEHTIVHLVVCQCGATQVFPRENYQLVPQDVRTAFEQRLREVGRYLVEEKEEAS
jgi:hypothetical protein